jgi:hypothetical protein
MSERTGRGSNLDGSQPQMGGCTNTQGFVKIKDRSGDGVNGGEQREIQK